jgi:hypothetical protein
MEKVSYQMRKTNLIWRKWKIVSRIPVRTNERTNAVLSQKFKCHSHRKLHEAPTTKITIIDPQKKIPSVISLTHLFNRENNERTIFFSEKIEMRWKPYIEATLTYVPLIYLSPSIWKPNIKLWLNCMLISAHTHTHHPIFIYILNSYCYKKSFEAF